MSITVLPPPDTSQINNTDLRLKLDNGDYEVFKIIKDKWGFKNEESLLRFALTILLKAENNLVEIQDVNGNKTTLKPSAELTSKG